MMDSKWPEKKKGEPQRGRLRRRVGYGGIWSVFQPTDINGEL
jgi:hypothetical protein